jgi:thymidylate synthase (FAD)
MTPIKTRSDFDVELQYAAGDDLSIVLAARTASGSEKQDGVEKLIKSLMLGRHGSTFEHNYMKFRITAPLFLWREWHRHRIGFSYNEESGRYKQLDPVFYIPGKERLLKCIKPEGFKAMRPGFAQFSAIPADQVPDYYNRLVLAYTVAYKTYTDALEAGMDNGLARITLPVATYSTCIVTCNLRSALSFLSLRRDYSADESLTHLGFTPRDPSYPQWEMDQLAKQFEAKVGNQFPLAYTAFLECGMRAP